MSARSGHQTLSFYKHKLFVEKQRRMKDHQYIADLINDKKWLLSEVERLRRDNELLKNQILTVPAGQ